MLPIKKFIGFAKRKVKYYFKVPIPQIFFSLFLPKSVLNGPFKGMKYVKRSTGSVILPKLIGTYEDELHHVLDQIRSRKYDLFIDIGAAEGYYAVGIPKYILPGVKELIAFETSNKGRSLIRELAKINGVNSIQIMGTCTINELKGFEKKKAFMLMDIEGGEYDLLKPDIIDFSNFDILVEIHFFDKSLNIEKEITSRFAATHSIKRIEKGLKKLPASLPMNAWIKKYGDYLVNEFRGEQSWLFLESKTK